MRLCTSCVNIFIMRKGFLITLFILVLSLTGLKAQSEAVKRMKRDLEVLCADSLKGRGTGTEYELKAATYLQRSMEETGLILLYPHPGQDFSIVSEEGDTLNSQNVVGIIEGWDPLLKNEYIVVGAHYDHLGCNKIYINGKDTMQIFRGADDNASGVAVMLEVARLAKAQSFNFRRSILFIGFGAEESGMVGSWYFTNRAFQHVEAISLMVNLDMVGRGVDGRDLHLYTVMPHTQTEALLREVSNMPAMISPKIHTGDYYPSDHRAFASLGIPVILFTTLLHNDYHSPRDVPEKIQYNLMEDISQYILNILKIVANRDVMLPKTPLSSQGKQEIIEDRVYLQSETDSRATFQKGDEKKFLEKWVHHYLKYPSKAAEKGIQGTVIVEFIVEKNGALSNFKVTKTVDSLLDAEALRVISVSPKWRPATIDKKPVRTKVTIPVEFRLKR